MSGLDNGPHRPTVMPADVSSHPLQVHLNQRADAVRTLVNATQAYEYPESLQARSVLERQLQSEAEKLVELLTACENEMDGTNISEFRNLAYIEHEAKELLRLIRWMMHGLKEERLGVQNPCEPMIYDSFTREHSLGFERKELMQRGFPVTSGFRRGTITPPVQLPSENCSSNEVIIEHESPASSSMSEHCPGNGSGTSLDFTSERTTSGAFSSIDNLDSIPGPSGMSKAGHDKWPKDSSASNMGSPKQLPDGNGVSRMAYNTRLNGDTVKALKSLATSFASTSSKYRFPPEYAEKVANIIQMLLDDDDDGKEEANLGDKPAGSDLFNQLSFELDSSLNDVD
ncbi:hypothetical protein HPB52_012435 [Rhipicephalus sanguineus]|uniref:Uncharacterized protein n=1 Tax=Rhipicephalus sanguineus TaxID=34632 RepID=A0A9D4YPH0_RHISA|nr:hypothetical protein HPB52_012435 [Rhipicephalus sanguineus]